MPAKQRGGSKFFDAGSDSDEGSEDDGRSSQSQSGSDSSGSGSDAGGGALKPASRFMAGSDSDSDEGPRVVRAKKDKAADDLEDKCSEVRAAMRGGEWNNANKLYAELDKLIKKSKNVLSRSEVGFPPQFYLKTIILLQDLAAKNLDTKTLNKLDAKAYNAMKMGLKKLDKDLVSKADAARKGGLTGADSDGAKDSDDDEDQSKSGSDDDESSEDDKWGTAGKGKAAAAKGKAAAKTGKSRWMMSDSDSDSEDDAAKSKKNDRLKAKAEAAKAAALHDSDQQDGKAKKPTDKKKKTNESDVRREIREISKKRGLLSTDVSAMLEQLRGLQQFVESPGLKIEMAHLIITTQFDLVTSSGTRKHFNKTQWADIANDIEILENQLDEHKNVWLAEGDSFDERSVQEASRIVDGILEEAASRKEGEMEVLKWNKDAPVFVRSTLLAHISALDDEWVRSIRATDPHTSNYVDLLRLDQRFVDLARRAFAYYQQKHSVVKSLVYPVAEEKAQLKRNRKAVKVIEVEDDQDRMNKRAVQLASRILERTYFKKECSVKDCAILTSLIYEFGDERQRTRALLQDVFNKALHDQYFAARDLLLMSHLHDTACSSADVSTQMMYNRANVALALAAFRRGHIKQAHNALADLFSSGRLRELLGQGTTLNRYAPNQDLEQKRLQEERMRQLPHHLHFNIEFVDAVYFSCALLLEVPALAAVAALTASSSEGAADPRLWQKRRPISRPFRKLVEFHDRQPFTAGIHAEPEKAKDSIVIAALALQSGDCKRASEVLLALKAWNMLPSAPAEGEPALGTRQSVQKMLHERIQVEGLRTYVFHFSQFYASMSLETLAKQFELPTSKVHSVVSKMIIGGDLSASWDQTTGAIVMAAEGGPSPLLSIAARFADKANALIESNERVMDARTGEQRDREQRNRQNRDDNRRHQDGNRQHNNSGVQSSGQSQRGGRQDGGSRGGSKGGNNQRGGAKRGGGASRGGKRGGRGRF